jgi:hypothetical protein
MWHKKNIRSEEGKIGNEKRSRFLFFIFYSSLFSFLFLIPCGGTAQTPPGNVAGEATPAAPEEKPVAVMAFVGDDLDQSERLRAAVVQEVENLDNYTPRQISSGEFPETLTSRPDEPPNPSYLGDMPYVLTGEYYFDTEDMGHFQIWLWNSADGSLVYTDELVAENIEEAESYLPALVAWVFSRIPVPPPPVQVVVDVRGAVEEVMAERRAQEEGIRQDPDSYYRLYLGLRGGGSASAYYSRTTGWYDAGMSQGFGGEAGFVVEYRPWKYLSFQGEAIFALDVFKVFKITQVGNQDIHTTGQYSALSMLFPLLIKTPIEGDKFSISLAGGIYYIVPIGQMLTEEGSYSYQIDLPLGFMAGIDLGHTLGPGELFMSLRYGRDMGMTIVRSGLQYTPNRMVLSVGYRFGFLKVKGRGRDAKTRTLTLTGTGTGTVVGTGTGTTGGAGTTTSTAAGTTTSAATGDATSAAAGTTTGDAGNDTGTEE